MSEIPIISFSAWSGTGKTTIIERLIAEIRSRGLKVAVIKHDAHRFEIDREGKDSWRFAQAGADMILLNSAEKTALIEQRSLSFSDCIAMIHDVDLILAEGYQQEDLPRIGISRKETREGFRLPLTSYIALVTDEDMMKYPEAASLPVFSLTDIRGITDYILSYLRLC